ncbi:alpha/beta hydrolase [Actinomycetospora sp. NBRC 106378]|uniref:alpha/beta hydrolase n=1 Tax=Actinomycetospora sp. NBRC 106378 TaxID=3032208 RepID=UPI0024A30872|nr:alpha/beta hydrolase [Actinomycetospora sp. NBRC 106378]GLZ53273.1 putative lipase LipH [Actinomycetospora sp. NBRC 106378]
MTAADPDVAALLARWSERGEPAMFEGTDTPEGIEAARERYAALLRETVRPARAAPEVRDDGPVPVRLHHPAERTTATLVVHAHGGGWVLGGGEVYDPIAQRLADDTGAVVAAVDYRLAPEHRFPAPLHDVLAGLAWAVDHAGEWDADPARVALVGDSAGANLVAGAALARRDRREPVVGTLLVYPPPDFEGRYPSVRENGEGLFLTAGDVVACSRLYLGSASPRGDIRLSPLRADLTGLGPTIVATAGLDPLRDAGRAFAEALTAAGVDARLREHPTSVHGFLGFTGVVPAADDAVAALHREFAALIS